MIALLLLSCTRSTSDVARPAAFEDPGLSSTGASPVIPLSGATGRFELPKTSLPANFHPSSKFPIEIEQKALKERRATFVFRGPSPFAAGLEEEARVSAPPGMSLYVDGELVPYHPNLLGQSWRLNGANLLVAVKENKAPTVQVAYPPVEAEVLRRDFSSAGLEPAAFVTHDVTLDSRTRHGLLLPAPAVGSWEVTLPPGTATFEAFVGLSPLPLQNLRSDGAYATLSVVADGGTTEVGRQFVNMADRFVPWRVDLSQWAGKSVTLRITTETYKTPDFDYVFLGSPAVWGQPTGPVRRVVVIGLDTTRPDHFGYTGYARSPTPELDAVANTSSVFLRTWAPAPRTRPSFRSAFTGRRPLDAVGAENIAAVFQRHGFATAGIVANVHLQPRFEFDEGFDDWWYDGQSKADAQVDRALAFFERYPDRDTFLFLHIMDPHLFYNAPGLYKDMYVTDPDPELPENFNRWEVYSWMKANKTDERRKNHIIARYDGELRFMSEQLGRLFAKLDQLPGRSLVVLHSDHGEEFWEHGGFEHNHTLFDETTRALLWFRAGPGQKSGSKLQAPATLADIAPTLFDFAKFTDVPPTDGKSLAPLLLGTDNGSTWDEREIGVAHLRYGTERWGVVHRGHKYVLHTASGEEELYDLTLDPTESKSIAPSVPLQPFREALAKAHDMQVGRGFRVRVDLYDQIEGPYVFELPEPARAAGVIDPEATIETPANQAWGEKPAKSPEDIGVVTLSEDRKTLTLVPGKKPQAGLLYVLFDMDVDPAKVVIKRGAASVAEPLVTVAAKGKAGWRAGRDGLELVPGTVLAPPVGEGARMRTLLGDPALDDANRQMLCDLGYLKCDGEEGEKGDDGH